MCKNKDINNNLLNDGELFDKVKKALLKLCEENDHETEYQLFEKRLRKATSFKDLSQ